MKARAAAARYSSLHGGRAEEWMMDRNKDREYYRKRARDERQKATVCEDNAVALAHFRMADAYEERVRDIEGRAVAEI